MTDLDAFLSARDLLIASRTSYEDVYNRFRWPSVTTFNWASDYFDTIAAENHSPALRVVEEDDQEVVLTYSELSDRSNQVANMLLSMNVSKGDRLLLMLGNEVPLWEVMLAAMKLGAVVVPTTTQLAGSDLADRIVRGNISAVVTNDTGVARFAELDAKLLEPAQQIKVGDAPEPGWHPYSAAMGFDAKFTAPDPTTSGDPLLEYFTSGTTAQPKLVQHTHASYPIGHLSTMYWLGLMPGDLHWTISSPGWAKHAWSCFFAPFNAQACVFIYNYSRFEPSTVLDVLARFEVDTLCAPPTVWRFLIQEDLDEHSVKLRELASAGEPLNPEVIQQIEDKWGLSIRDGYGQTETTALVGNPPGADLVHGSMGRPLPGYKIVLLDPEDQEVDEGEIAVALGGDRPIGLMTGYADELLSHEVTRGGHYRTGDIGKRNADGYITYVGRSDDVFKSSGYRISPFELESLLIEHPAVAEAAVVPSPDQIRGFVPKAYIVIAPATDLSPKTVQSIFAFLNRESLGYKTIRRIEFANELPKTVSGKIRRVDLREQEMRRIADDVRNENEFHERDFRP